MGKSWRRMERRQLRAFGAPTIGRAPGDVPSGPLRKLGAAMFGLLCSVAVARRVMTSVQQAVELLVVFLGDGRDILLALGDRREQVLHDVVGLDRCPARHGRRLGSRPPP